MKKVWFFLHFFGFLGIIDCLYFLLFAMKKISYAIMMLFVMLWCVALPVYTLAQSEQKNHEGKGYFSESADPMTLVTQYYRNTNKTDPVQETDLDVVTSDGCTELRVDGRFTISRTLCNIKSNIWNYLQYLMYIWLTAATIFLIRNGLKIVTSPDKEKQMSTFKKNLIYIIIWVVLLTWFYYVIDIFVSVVNLVEK